MVGGAESIKSSLDEQTNSELERCGRAGEQVLCLRYVADLTWRESCFGIGILNTGDENKFKIVISLWK